MEKCLEVLDILVSEHITLAELRKTVLLETAKILGRHVCNSPELG